MNIWEYELVVEYETDVSPLTPYGSGRYTAPKGQSAAKAMNAILATFEGKKIVFKRIFLQKITKRNITSIYL